MTALDTDLAADLGEVVADPLAGLGPEGAAALDECNGDVRR